LSTDYLSNHKTTAWEGQDSVAIILAGGLGTRLRSTVPNLPKCMAPVAGQPFLYYVINHLRMQGIHKIIFSLGYMHHIIEEWLAKEFSTMDYEICIEEEPLGTGGAIQLALHKASAENVFVANGDTLFRFNAAELLQTHKKNNAECTLALKPMLEFDRYGVVELDKKNIITSFKEKQYYKKGLINAGLYLINKKHFLQKKFPSKFSFEKDYLEKFVGAQKFSGIAQNKYFIDIGIPEDYNKAQNDLAPIPLAFSKIDKTWTLFLDRDGVINHDKVGSYVFNADEFIFTEGAPTLFKKLTEKFHKIIIITNQRGVGRGLMTQADLDGIHEKLNTETKLAEGKIEAIYFTTDTDSKSFMRKPNPGMALQAIFDYPEINFSKSIMVGNNISDMKFGRNAGMYTVFLTTTVKDVSPDNFYVDKIFSGLLEFANSL
jgi:D-glycero-alpha-D-manno-heptose 1-phosphate guanylyltransferase